MKTDKKTNPKLDELLPLLMHFYRKDSHEEGPSDFLQTREFKKIADLIAKGDESFYPYLLYFFPLRYQEGLSLISELPKPPTRVLDLFSRLGPFSLAAVERGAREVYMLDSDIKFLEIGAQIIGRMGYPIQKRVWEPGKSIPVEGKFDLIILAYPTIQLTDDFIIKLMDRLTPDGHILFVESSQPGANKELLIKRDRFVKMGYPVQAPCVWKGECPALKSNAPCYAQREYAKPRLLKDLQRSAGINLSSLKMSYLILRTKEAGWPEVEPCYRVISPPIDTLQGKRFFLCGTDGKKTLGSTLVEHPKASRAFEYLKRGELIAFENITINNNALEITKDSIIKVIAPIGKPVPDLNEESSL